MADVPVHKDFADWYRVVSLDPQPQILERRWQGVVAFSKETKALDIPDLARVFYGRKPKQENFLERLRAAFKTHDESFQMRDNSAELQVLAGAAIVELLRYGDGWNDAAAFAVVVGECKPYRVPPVRDVVLLAREHLTKASAQLRTKGQFLDLSPKISTLKTVLDTNEVSKIKEPLLATIQALANSIQFLNRQEQLRREECNVLWWLFGEHSRDLDKPFQELTPPSAILVGAKELSDLTTAMPGPFSARAFLDTVIRTAHHNITEKQSVPDVLAACPLAWQKQFVGIPGIANLDDLCPIHAAAVKSVEIEGKKGWQTAYTALTGLKSTAKFDPLEMAMQSYEERLLIRTVERLNKVERNG